MRLIDADAIFPWYVEAFKGMIEPNEVRFSMNDIKGNLDNIPTLDTDFNEYCPYCGRKISGERWVKD